MWKCNACNEPLVVMKTQFSYMDRSFTHEVERCPKCGKVNIPLELAEGRMAEVEEQLEDK
ncbi:MAG: DNA-binding protein [Oscillospiraceae bacterium]|nr:DNA-binding protein [Oscillospiraceae bacterium]